MYDMKILAIETSCDETGAAIVFKDSSKNHVRILSNVIASSLILHSKTGGIIPEVAAREQVKYIIPVIKKAIENCKLKIKNLDAIAVTVGPGLIGSLLVGVETAKTLAYLWKKPIIPVNHLLGHIYANWLTANDSPRASLAESRRGEAGQRPKTIEFPALSLLVSGGHTDLILMKGHGNFEWLGGTRDDAAGEAFDKIGRLLNLPYPAGPKIEKLAEKGNPEAFNFPRPMIYSKNFDFSFSGLKTAILREVKTIKQFNNLTISNLCASAQKAIVDVLVQKTIKAAKKYNVKSILLGGGVASNQKLRDELELNAKHDTLDAKIFVPNKNLCTDNAAMIASFALFNYKPTPWQTLTANPELYFD